MTVTMITSTILVLLATTGVYSQLSSSRSTLCSSFGGICSYKQCSRYYVPSLSAMLCSNAYQKCCLTEKCMQQYKGGYCQNSRDTCNGGKYLHNGFEMLCAQGQDVCCIESSTQTQTAPPTIPPPTTEACAGYKGTCLNQINYRCNGEFRLFGSKMEFLCKNWSSNNERCCVAKTAASTPAAKTPAPRTDSCRLYGGTCADQTRYTCDGGQFRLRGSSNEYLCPGWATNNERCCMADNRSGSSSGSSSGTGSGTSSGSHNIPDNKPVAPPTSTSGCGIPKIKLTNKVNKRVVGGRDAEHGEWPWQVSIVKQSRSFFGGSSYQHTCGGTLIAPQWVLTAAHCFRSGTSAYYLRVRVGEHSFLGTEGTENDLTIDNIFIHPQYIDSQNKNDIALMKLKTPVNMNDQYVNTACMPQESDMSAFYSTSDCWVTGWGRTQGAGDKNILKEVQSTLVSQSSCYQKWGYKIDNTKVCFGNGVRGACQGDSGGPLVCKKNGVFYLVGVVSYGTLSCKEIYVPTVFTKVAAYKKWIDDTIAYQRG